ncbi:MAG: choice-of-anchor J domain-containing protein [Ignavibacteria bacterium]|nr:choice-of-anchor J domain-containing protein [Ignavibacteria bacterium]
MKTKFTLIVSITVLVLGLLIGFILEDPFGSRTPATNQTEVIQQSSNTFYTDGTPVYTDDFDGANDTTALKARGYLPYYRGTGPQGSTATWFQGNASVFPAFNGPTSGYVAANYNVVTGANNIDSWLVLPRLSSGGIQAGDTLYFYSRGPTGSTYPDSIRVMYSVGDSVPEGTWTELGRFKANTTTGWELRGFRAPTTSANGRFAIRYCVANGGPSGTNSDYIGIDALSIVRTTVVSGPQYYNYNTGGSSNSFPFNVAGGKATNYLFLPGSINQPSPVPSGNQITKVYFRHSASGTRTFTNYHILLAQSTITDLTSGAFYAGPWDTVYSAASVTLSSTTGEFTGVQLDHPFPYDPTKSLIIFMGQCGATGSGLNVYNTSVSGIKRVWSVGGCPFVPYAGGDAYNVHFGVDVEPAVSYTPDLLYYKFENNTVGFTPNCAYPGVGTNPAPYAVHTLTSGGQFDTCISGTGATNSGVTTGWNNDLGSGSWTISMWLNDLPSNTSLYYLWGDPSGSFRCFLGGAAGAGNILFRGTGITDVNIPAVAPGPTVVHIVYDSASHTVFTYKNGVPSVSVVQATPLNLATGTGFKVAAYSTSAGLNGKMDEFRAYRWALSATDVANSWNVDVACGTVTGIGNNNNFEIPQNYMLNQNYPNPFNPVTKISFAIPKSGLVTLKVYDVIGREVASLVNAQKNAGSYIVDFDASNLSSGIYFYRLDVNGFVDTKKMMVIK